MLKFPFWVILPGHDESPSPHKVSSTPDFPIAFSATEKMMPYLTARDAGDWRMRLVNSTTLLPLIADLHDLRSKGIYLDPKLDGSDGTEIPLSALIQAATVRP